MDSVFDSPIILLLPVVIAFILDAIIGDPLWLPHPVVGMGKAIALGERSLNQGTALRRKICGMALTLSMVLGVYALTGWLIKGFTELHPLWGFTVEILVIASALAGKSLYQAGYRIATALKKDDLVLARQRLQGLVSRDTKEMGQPEIVRGTVESLLENFVDGFLSPFLFALIGGAPLVMAFKAVSTLDSMIGYRSERYHDFGWFAARLDDVANYIPARLGVFILLMAGGLLRMPVHEGYRIWKRDAHKHPSPNGGNPESVGAGLLGVRLGGVNHYFGRQEYRAELGDARNPLTAETVWQTLRLIRTACWLTWGITLIGGALWFIL